MAKTCCLNCDAMFLMQYKNCPECGTFNYFSEHTKDDVVLCEAIHVLCDQTKYEIAEEQKAKMAERKVRMKDLQEMRPPTPWKKFWRYVLERF